MSATDMPIKAIAPWFGGKRTLAPRIIEELGAHRAYWEPFAGSMAILMAKPARGMETVNDLHGDIINLARVIQHPTMGPMLYRRLRRVLCDERAKALAAEMLAESIAAADPVDRAYHYFIDSWLGRNGSAGTTAGNNFCRRFTANGGSPSVRFEQAVASIPAWRRRMRRVIVLQADAFDLLARIQDTPGTAIYVDPPYLAKGASYVHDFWESDHVKLANALRRFEKARVVVSYYDDPVLATLYPGWTVRDVAISKATAHQGRRGSSDAKAPEVLLINGPSLTGGAA